MPIYFTYLIGWTSQNKWYYGVRYAKDAHPSSLWTTYFTSSKTVKGFRQKHGEPDVIKIRKLFANKQKALLWEQRILSRLGVPFNTNWLNANVGGYCGPKKSGKGIKKQYLVNNPMINVSSREKLSRTRKEQGLGLASAKHLRAKFGDYNPMRNPEILAKYKQSIAGRKRLYAEDGTWKWHHPNKELPK